MNHELIIAIPMKSPVLAKTRLAENLSVMQRQQLAIGLFEHTVAFFRQTYPEFPTIVVTASQQVAQIATSLAAYVLDEKVENGLNNAANLAKNWAMQNKFQALLIVPADIPVLQKSEMDNLFQLSKRYAVVIVESVHGGTNALLISPPNSLVFQYGKNSAKAHATLAKRTQLDYYQLQCRHLSRDIDTLPDLIALSSVLPNDCAWHTTHLPSCIPQNNHMA
ncbi:MAG: 2-phospho-L-lactate guanylyltransferase [Neisseriales bacterium]|nr:MAG: 2-phospho-L-lactate guanylyltransferase [Neisseriales bacterium]